MFLIPDQNTLPVLFPPHPFDQESKLERQWSLILCRGGVSTKNQCQQQDKILAAAVQPVICPVHVAELVGIPRSERTEWRSSL